MKKTLLVGLAIGLVSMAATSAFAGKSPTLPLPTPGYASAKNVGGTGIVGSSHDLSNAGNKTGSIASNQIATGGNSANQDPQSRICVYCHHPHNAFAAGTNTGGRTGAVAAIGSYSPLWNRNMSTVTFAAYSNGAMMNEATSVTGTDKRHVLNAGSNVLSGVSLLCMSCHDGVVAMNAFSQSTGSSLGQQAIDSTTNITSSAGFKGNMNNHHPMGFVYQTVQGKDAEIAPATTVMVPKDGDVGATVITGTTTIGDLLYGSPSGATFECVTCHDVHNTANQNGAERFLWRSNNKSNFCLTCHLK